jgi:hypothetical protein
MRALESPLESAFLGAWLRQSKELQVKMMKSFALSAALPGRLPVNHPSEATGQPRALDRREIVQ